LLGNERCQPEYAKATYKCGQRRKEAGEFADTLFVAELGGISVVYKQVFERLFGVELFENGFNFSESFTQR